MTNERTAWQINVDACEGLNTVTEVVIGKQIGIDLQKPQREWKGLARHATEWELTFCTDILEKAQRWELSEKQRGLIARVARNLTERKEERDNASPVPEGQRRVEGVIIKIKEQFSNYSPESVLKCLLACDGYKLWGTLPAAVSNDAEEGDRIAFYAEVKASDDNGFGFYRRPTNAERLS
tara:strand:- start:3595 stop:4134 length:540 start_codon:yes stop_codon:yes gene_type:complete